MAVDFVYLDSISSRGLEPEVYKDNRSATEKNKTKNNDIQRQRDPKKKI